MPEFFTHDFHVLEEYSQLKVASFGFGRLHLELTILIDEFVLLVS